MSILLIGEYCVLDCSFENIVPCKLILLFLTKRYDSKTGNIISPVSLVPGKWHHLAYSLSGSVVSIYVDGVLVVQGTSSYTSGQLNASTAYLGFDGDWRFVGLIDDVKIFKKVLSVDEISTMLSY